MQILADSCLALLASVGLWTLFNMLSDLIFQEPKTSHDTISVQICDDYQALDLLLQKHFCAIHDLHIILVDYDFSYEKDLQFEMPTEKPVGVMFCSCKQFSNKLKEAKKWTIQKSTIK